MVIKVHTEFSQLKIMKTSFFSFGLVWWVWCQQKHCSGGAGWRTSRTLAANNDTFQVGDRTCEKNKVCETIWHMVTVGIKLENCTNLYFVVRSWKAIHLGRRSDMIKGIF